MNYKKIALAKVLQNKDLELFSKLSINHFTDRNSKAVYRAILGYHKSFEKIPEASILTAAMENQLPVQQAKILNGYIEGLGLIELPDVNTDEVISGLSDGSIVSAIDNNLEALVQAGEARDIPTIKELLHNISSLTTLGNVAPKNADEIVFSIDNIKAMDSFIPSVRSSGTKLSGVVLISGSSGGGKSIFALNQAIYSYEVENADVLYINLELSENEQMARMLSHNYQHDFGDIYRVDLTPKEVNDWNKKREAMFSRDNKFKMINMTVNKSNIMSAIEHEATTGLDLVVIDYLQIVENDGYEESWKFIENLVKDLHRLALRLGIVILTPIQINTGEVKEEENEIKLTTRGSRELEFSSTLWWHIYQNTEDYNNDVARLFTVKSRQSKKYVYILETKFNLMTFADTGTVM